MSNKIKKQLRALLGEKRRDKRQIYKKTKRFLESQGKLFAGSDKEAYFYNRTTKELHQVSDTLFKKYIASELYFDRSDQLFSGVIKHIEDHVYKKSASMNFYKLAHYDEDSGKLYVNQFGGKMHVLDGEKIRLVNLGTDGVFFRDSDSCEPYEIEKSEGGLTRKYLFRKDNFLENPSSELKSKDQEFLLKSWVYSLFFRELYPSSKPILVFYGTPNSYKTETARSILTFLFGRMADVSDPPRTSRDLNVIADASHVLFLDDFAQANKNLEKPLVRISTGMTATERELYTNKGVSTSKPDVFIGITAKEPYFSQEDFLQRCLIIRLESGTSNTSASDIKKGVLANRNKIWGEVLNRLNTMVKRLKKKSHSAQVKFRMAVWADLLLKTNPKKATYIEGLLQKINRDQISFLIESNPLAMALSIWLKDMNNLGAWRNSGKIRDDLREIASERGLPFKDYEDNQVFGPAMTNIASTFTRLYRVETARTRGRNRYRFSNPSK